MAEGDRLQIELRRSGEMTVVLPRGELDLAGTPEFERTVRDACALAPSALLVDLGELAFLDSTGLRAILSAQRQSTEAGIEFAVLAGRAQVARLMEITGTAEHIRVVSRAEDLAAGA